MGQDDPHTVDATDPVRILSGFVLAHQITYPSTYSNPLFSAGPIKGNRELTLCPLLEPRRKGKADHLVPRDDNVPEMSGTRQLFSPLLFSLLGFLLGLFLYPLTLVRVVVFVVILGVFLRLTLVIRVRRLE